MNLRSALFVALSLCVLLSSGRAVTASKSVGSASATITANYNPSTGKVDYTWSHNGIQGVNNASVQMRIVVANGSYSGTTYISTNAAGGSSGSASTPAVSVGQWIFVQAGASGPGGSYQELWEEIGAVTWKVTFALPANTTDRLIRYEVWQDGAFTGFSATQSPGDAAREYTAQPLPNDHVATLREVRVNLEQGEDGMWYVGDSDLVRVVNGGTTPIPSTSSATPGAVAGPADPVSGQPTPPRAVETTKAPEVDAPAPSSSVTVPGSLPTPNPTPTGTGGATKADIEKAANDITSAVSAANVQATTNANAIIAAVNAASTAASDQANAIIRAANTTSTAVDNVTRAVGDGLSAVGSKIDLTNTKLEAISGKIETGNSNTAAAVSKLGEISSKLGPTSAEAQAAADASYSAAQTAGSAAGTAAAASINTAVPTLAPVQPSSSSSAFEIAVPGVATFSLDPASNSSVSNVIQWVRGFMAWLIGLGFWWWLWAEFKGLMSVAVGLPQAKGNTVAAGTGGQATSLVAAAAISVVLVGLPTAFFALTSFGAGLAANPFSGAPGPVAMALYLVYQVFPVEVIVSAIVAAFAVRKGGLVILASTAAIVRHIVP